MRPSPLLWIALIFAAPAQSQSVKAGIEAWQRADYSSAVSIWRPLAEAGDPDAMFNLGQAYRLGRGVQTNLAAAQTWLDRAARKGHLDAQTTLGLLLFDNGNSIAGLRWLKSAAERGEPRALLIYGTALFNGDNVERDPVLAYAYVSRAAAQGLAPAKQTLAEMDKILPLDQRQQGVAIAIAKAKTTKPAAANPAPAKTAAAKSPAQAVKRTVEKPAPVAVATSSGGWRIQLGAFSKHSSAEALYKKLSGRLGGKQAAYIPAGAVTRLQVGPYPTRAAASAACASLGGQACFPVAAK